jgi:DNA-binding response OmpR family regulator
MANKLLLADDSPTIAKILGMALQSENYEIRSVLTAEDAEKELRNNTPNYFLVDLTLPGKSGYEFAAMIKKDSKLKKIKVVLLASAFDPADEEEVAKCGANGVITKPFDPSDLREKLRNLANEPMKYPKGSKVEGSLSGSELIAEASPATSPSFPTVQIDPLELNFSPKPSGGDANDILSGALGIGTSDAVPTKTSVDLDSNPSMDLEFGSNNASVSADTLLANSLPANAEGMEGYQPTLQIDLSGGVPEFQPQEQVLDLSASFHGGSETPLKAPPSPSAPAQIPEAHPIEKAAQKTKTSLSANAQALAAFFAAELDSKTPAEPPTAPPNLPPPPSLPKPSSFTPPSPAVSASPSAPTAFPEASDSFDASLDSIEWGESPKNLNSWSSSSLGKPQPAAKPALVKPASTVTPPPAPPPLGSGAGAASGDSSFMFDTGDSSFRFAEDYIHRITKAFTGSPDEMILGKDPSPPKPQAIFPRTSSDAPPPVDSGFPRAELPNTGRGAWTPEEEKRIEQLVKEEVQMVVREVAEKVAWEVIPELAENIIRKELDKVLKEMEE